MFRVQLLSANKRCYRVLRQSLIPLPQAATLVVTGNESTECFFFSPPRGRLIPAPFTVISTYMCAALCGRRCRLLEQNMVHFNFFWITPQEFIVKRLDLCIYFWVLHVEDKPLCDSHVVAGLLMADDSSIYFAENEASGERRNWFEILCLYRINKLQIHSFFFFI